MIVEPCSIRDLEDVNKIASEFYGKDTFMHIRQLLCSSTEYIFKSDDGFFVLYNTVALNKFSVHIIGNKKNTKDFKNFIIHTALWLFNNTMCTSIIIFVNKKERARRMLIGSAKATLSGGIKYNDGSEDLIYTYIKDNMELYKEML
jgi:hypothetical protein